MSEAVLFALTMAPQPQRSDDELIPEIMQRIYDRYPGVIEGYQYERLTEDTVHILVWGDIEE